MEQDSTKTQAGGTAIFAGEVWFDPAANASRFGEIEAGIRDRMREFISCRMICLDWMPGGGSLAEFLHAGLPASNLPAMNVALRKPWTVAVLGSNHTKRLLVTGAGSRARELR